MTEVAMSSELVTYFPDVSESTEDAVAALSNTVEHDQGLQGREARHNTQKDTELADDTLLKQISQGKRDALAILFRRHAESIRNVAQRILRDEAEADELLQDIFLYISRKAALFKPSHTSARSWIYHVTYHRAFDRRRHLAARHHYDMEVLNEFAVTDRDHQAEVIFEQVAVKDIMEKFEYQLSKEQRQTIHLFFVEGYSLREIAERTGQTLGNVRNHYYRGLERLRSYVLKEKVQSK
jgi:RNA polymerase sigma-70 factor, ECF subfamily